MSLLRITYKSLIIKKLCFLPLLTFFIVCTSFVSPYQSFKGVKTVVIDAGHGGKDPGCHGVSYKEKDVALGVALKLGNYIEENFKDVKVVYTRKTDVFIELNERAAIANRANADLFICIHCNASVNKNAFGSETYIMGLHKSKGNLEVAKRENAAILLEDDYKKKYEGFDPNSDEAAIIFSFYQNTFMEQSLNLASKIQKHYKEKAGRVDKGVKQAGFLVLWKTAMPSLLTEMGFLTNPEEEQILGSEKGQEAIANSIFTAFSEYKNETEGLKTKTESKIEKITNKIDTINKPKADSTLTKSETIVFKIQIATSDKSILNDEKFKGVDELKEVKDGKLFKYLVGEYDTFDKASKAQFELRKKGFPDAFVIAQKDGIKISLGDAIKQKKEKSKEK